MRLLYSLLFSLLSITVTGQPLMRYIGGEVFTVKSQDNTNLMTPAGSGGQVSYHRLSNSYTITWRQQDGSERKVTLKPIGKLEDLQLFQDEAGKQYALDTGNLASEGVLFALLVDLKTKSVSNDGLLVTGLRAK